MFPTAWELTRVPLSNLPPPAQAATLTALKVLPTPLRWRQPRNRSSISAVFLSTIRSLLQLRIAEIGELSLSFQLPPNQKHETRSKATFRPEAIPDLSGGY